MPFLNSIYPLYDFPLVLYLVLNPTEEIGKSKELLESCCKEICNNLGENKQDNLKLTQLVKETFRCLKIPNESMIIYETEDKIVRQIIGSLNGLASGINDLRNHYGSGHGREMSFKALSKKHVELSVGASITLTRYFWDSFREIENGKKI
ncbi:abortive infection family protein [Finegoldia magna]|uniref:abortive infection family protein n=2 Tax=Bacillota TaxID=1239 RepID=UPI002FF4BBAB